MPPVSVIELDLAAAWEPPERPGLKRSARRGIALVLVLVAVLAGLTASMRRAALGPLYAIDGEQVLDFVLDDRAVYVRRSTDDGTVVQAYRLADGHQLWSARQNRSAGMLAAGDDRVLLAVPDPTSQNLPDASVVVALDAADGHAVWRRANVLPTFGNLGGDDMTVVEPFVPGVDDLPSAAGRGKELDVLDVRTGDLLRADIVPAGSKRSIVTPSSFDIGGLQVAQLDPDGAFTLRDVRTGAVQRTARLLDLGQFDGFDVNGDLLLTYLNGQYGPRASVMFDLRSGRRLWQQPGSPEPSLLTWWCGVLLCASDEAGSNAVDPRTGKLLWQVRGGGGLTQVDERSMMVSESHVGPDGIAVSDVSIVDVGTGQVRRQLPGWQILDWRAWPRLLAVQPLGRRTAALGRLDGVTGRASVFGRITPIYGPARCLPAARPGLQYLACQAGTAVQVWRIPP